MTKLSGEAPLATCRNYGELICALRDRILALNTTTLAVDHASGLPDGYTSKLFADAPIRSLGRTSLGPLLATLGVQIVLVMAPNAAQITKRLEARKFRPVQSAALHIKLTRKFMREIGRKGGLNSRKYLGKRKAQRASRVGARARWSKTRPVQNTEHQKCEDHGKNKTG
jgi:general stress protein YciG